MLKSIFYIFALSNQFNRENLKFMYNFKITIQIYTKIQIMFNAIQQHRNIKKISAWFLQICNIEIPFFNKMIIIVMF